MILQELLENEWTEGRVEAMTALILELLLSKFKNIPETVAERISSEKNPEVLEEWFKAALSCDTIEKYSETVNSPK